MDKFFKPKTFDVEPSAVNSTKLWAHWLKSFNHYLSVLPFDSVDDHAKLGLLVNNISTSVYEYISECTTFDSALQTLKDLYEKPSREVFARYKLLTCTQKEGETVDQFMNSLKELSRKCNFQSVDAAKSRDDYIRDAFIRGMNHDFIRQRLFENNTLTLQGAYDQARTLEQAQDMHKASQISVPVKAAKRLSFNATGNKLPAAEEDNSENSEDVKLEILSTVKLKKCFYCGEKMHQSLALCPASETICPNCNVKGHLAKMCRKKSPQKSVAVVANENGASSEGAVNKSRKIALGSLSLKVCVDEQITPAATETANLRPHLEFDYQDHPPDDEDASLSESSANDSRDHRSHEDENQAQNSIYDESKTYSDDQSQDEEDLHREEDCDSNNEARKVVVITQSDITEKRTVEKLLNSFLQKRCNSDYYLKKAFIVLHHNLSPLTIFERRHERHIALLKQIRRLNRHCDLSFYHHHNRSKFIGHCTWEPLVTFLIKCRDPTCPLKQKIVYFCGQEPRKNACTVYLLEKSGAKEDHALPERPPKQGESTAIEQMVINFGPSNVYYNQLPDVAVGKNIKTKLFSLNSAKKRGLTVEREDVFSEDETDLIMTANFLRETDTENKIIPGFVQSHCLVQSKIIMQSEWDIRELGKCSDLILYLDCTGGIIKGAQGRNYMYHALVYQSQSGAPPLTAISMLSQRNPTYCVEGMLETLIVNYEKVHSEELSPKCVVTDHKYPNLHAILAAFQLGNLPDYLDKVWNLSEEEEADFTMIKICKTRFMKMIVMRCKKNYPDLRPKDRRIIMTFFVDMIEATSKAEVYVAFRKLATVLQSPFIGEEVRRAVDRDDCIDFASDHVEPIHAVVVQQVGRYREKCAVGRKFAVVAEEIKNSLSHDGATENPLYSPKMMEDILTYCMPFTPLWCGVQGGAMTNGLVEDWLRIVKFDIFQGKRATLASFVRTMYKQTRVRSKKSAQNYKIVKKMKTK